MPVKNQFSRTTDLPSCSLDIAALQSIQGTLPVDFKIVWTASVGERQLQADSISELAKEVSSWGRVDSLKLWATRHRGDAPDDRSMDSVHMAIERYWTVLSVSTEVDPAPVVWIHESIIRVCRAHHRLWNTLTGNTPLILVLWSASVGVLLNAGIVMGAFLRHRSLAGAVAVWVAAGLILVLGIVGIVGIVGAKAFRRVRLVGPLGEKTSLIAWRSVVNSTIAGLIVLAVGVLIGRACQ